MSKRLTAGCQPMLIGSLPLKDHRKATDLVWEYTPQIPSWVQLPIFPEELMVPQFAAGLPGLKTGEGRTVVDRTLWNYEEEVLAFYEEYLSVEEGSRSLDESRFGLDEIRAKGFTVFLERLQVDALSPVALKGQVTGPITFCTALRDEQDAAIFYDSQLRDAGVKLLAMKARWQIRKLAAFNRPVVIFCDEPALAGYGSSEFISISREDILACLREVVGAIHEEGALAGVHVCANTDWSLVLDSGADIVNFDAYEYFDRFMLYRDQIFEFVNTGNIIAWGIVPTLDKEAISEETTESLLEQWKAKAGELEKMGIERSVLRAQSLITPSCGAGSLPPELALKVLRLTREISDRLRSISEKEG